MWMHTQDETESICHQNDLFIFSVPSKLMGHVEDMVS